MVKTKKDLTGMRFGKLVVICQAEDEIGSNGDRIAKWKCQCDCGNICTPRGTALNGGKVHSCGCLAIEKNKAIATDYSGQIVNGFKIISRAPNKNNHIYWNVICPYCNKEFVSRIDNIKKRESCGCVNHERFRKYSSGRKKHNTYDLTTYPYGVGYDEDGNSFYFDLEDYDKIKNYYWTISSCSGYVISATKSRSLGIIKLHRVIMNATDSDVVDHIGGTETITDNRKCNLRLCTDLENAQNHKLLSTNTSGHTGVIYDKARNKWRATMIYKGEHVINKRFDTFEEALEARKEVERMYQKEFSYDHSQKIYNENKPKD